MLAMTSQSRNHKIVENFADNDFRSRRIEKLNTVLELRFDGAHSEEHVATVNIVTKERS